MLRRLQAHADEIATASVVWNELLFGARRLPDGPRRRTIDRYLDGVIRGRLPILPYDEAAADWHASQRVRLSKLGRTPAFVDGQIAAIAAVRSFVLVTANIGDFEVFEGLDVEDWRS